MGNPYDQGLFQHESGPNYFHLLREVLLTYRQMLRQLTAETGLSGAQFEALRELAVAGGRSTVSAMSRELGVDPAAVSRLVAGLVRAGLVERVQDERDGRSQPVVLSEAGHRLMLAFHTEAHKREEALGGLLDSESVETAMQVLRTLREALGRMSRPQSRPRPRNDTVEGGQS